MEPPIPLRKGNYRAHEISSSINSWVLWNLTVNAAAPGLIDTPLTRHKERYAQVLEASGRVPTGSAADEEEAKKT